MGHLQSFFYFFPMQWHGDGGAWFWTDGIGRGQRSLGPVLQIVDIDFSPSIFCKAFDAGELRQCFVYTGRYQLAEQLAFVITYFAPMGI